MIFDPYIAINIASEYYLPSELVLAIIKVESGNNCFAMRYEPTYQWLWDVEKRTPWHDREPFPSYAFSSSETERIGQKISWGPMQIMGALARELGYSDRFPKLCGPTGLHYGCKYLARLATRFKEDDSWDPVVAAYNAGVPRRTPDNRFVNQDYVDSVTKAARKIMT